MPYRCLSRIFQSLLPLMHEASSTWDNAMRVLIPFKVVSGIVQFLIVVAAWEAGEFADSYLWRSRSASYFEFMVAELEKSAPLRTWPQKGPEKRIFDVYPYWTEYPPA